MFLEWGEDLARLQWRGRWRDLATLWHYVQELEAVSVLQQYPVPLRARIEEIGGLLDALVSEALEDLDAEG